MAEIRCTATLCPEFQSKRPAPNGRSTAAVDPKVTCENRGFAVSKFKHFFEVDFVPKTRVF
jgi:hypothetical protein